MVLRLDPPELGQLRVDVRMHDQMLVLRFQAETQAGHDALQTRLTHLRAALEQHGIQLDRVEVEFRPPPSPGSQGSEADGRQYNQGTGGGGDSSFGHTHDHDGSASESFGSGEFPGPPGETEPETPPVGNNEPADDDVARPAETGVDLIV
jgi:flagellar hook-length control protein FliK